MQTEFSDKFTGTTTGLIATTKLQLRLCCMKLREHPLHVSSSKTGFMDSAAVLQLLIPHIEPKEPEPNPKKGEFYLQR